MRKGRIFLYILIPILLISGGWVLFNSVIRPGHYQLLFPYSIFHARGLAVTDTRVGADGRLQILIPEGAASVGKDDYAAVVQLDGFWIDQTPVTVAAYKKFVSETRSLAPRYRDEYAKYWLEKEYELLPVVFVSWGQAEQYCEYYGGHLPSEAQWEKAARGPEGIVLYWDDSEKAFDQANYDGFYQNEKTPAGWLPKGKKRFTVFWIWPETSGNGCWTGWLRRISPWILRTGRRSGTGNVRIQKREGSSKGDRLRMTLRTCACTSGMPMSRILRASTAGSGVFISSQ